MNLQMPPQSSLPSIEGTPSDDFPWSCYHLRSQIRGQLLREWQVWHIPRDDFPFSPTTKLSAIFTLPRHTATRLFQMKLAASYLLGHPNWHRPDPGLCPRCEERSRPLSTPCSAAPHVSTPGGTFPRPWTSNPPGMTPLQLRCLLHSFSTPSLPSIRASPPGGR